MPLQVVAGATLRCTMGSAPSALVVLPKNFATAQNPPAATILDHVPMINVLPFGLCRSLANPAVASATAAAAGVLTPMPCIPVIPAPWAPGAPNVHIAGQPALDDTSKCSCTWAGVISVTNAGESTVEIP